MFQKVLVASRGEIAVRIIRALREMGIKTVAVCSEADREALPAQLADESICIGPAPSADSYLNMEQIISATIAAGAEAIHPGYGFLSENAKFAQMCEKCHISFIGPSSEAIRLCGNKAAARKTMEEANVPIIPGTKEPLYDVRTAKTRADKMGYPLMIKASVGGGGKGMRIVERAEEFEQNFLTAQQEAEKSFQDSSMYLERYIRRARHIEVQLLADRWGNVIQLGERDCSIQRNHQKLLEEAPCPALSKELRRELGETAVRAAKAVGYENAGTIEFLYCEDGSFYFMEMNTRIQVEHPVTEMVTGMDLIKAQVRIAAGEKLSVRQEDISIKGHAIECRINARCPGTVTQLHLPNGNRIRVDTALYQGCVVSPYYDSMIAKVIVHGEDREEAVQKMCSALGELIIEGVDTNLEEQYQILMDKRFLAGQVDTHFIPASNETSDGREG